MLKTLLSRPVTVAMLLLLLVLVGIISVTKIRRQLKPEGWEPRFLFVQVYNFQLSPEESDIKIADPISGLLRQIKGVNWIRTHAGDTNVGVEMDFKKSVNMRSAYLEIVNVLERAREFLPEDAKTFIWRWNPSTSPVIWAGFQVAEHVDKQQANRDFENRISPQIQRIEGVAKVEVHGLSEPRAVIKLNENLLRLYQVSPETIISKLRDQNMTASMGFVGPSPVMLVNRLKEAADLENVAIQGNLRLKHLGTVTIAEEEKTRVIRIDGEDFYWMSISKQDGANVLDVSRAISGKLKEIEQQTARTYSFQVFWDEGKEVADAIGIITKTAFFAGAIAFVVVLCFLRNGAMTIYAATAIPLSILATISWLYFTGQTLNILSMMGIMLATGMVVDNGIVVIEAISRHLENGLAKGRAIVQGVSDVALPIVMATLTSIAVFLPLILMDRESDFSFFMAKLGLPVCVALLASLMVALVFIPFAVRNLNFNLVGTGKELAPYRLLERLYSRMLGRALNYRLEACVLFLVFVAVTLWAKDRYVVAEDRENLTRYYFAVEFDDSLPWHERLEIAKTLETKILAQKQAFAIEHVRLRIERRSCCAQFRIQRHVAAQRSNKELRQTLSREFPNVPGVNYRMDRDDENTDEFNRRSILFTIKGPKLSTINRLTDKIKKPLVNFPGVSEVRVGSSESNARNVEIVPDELKSNASGITPSKIAQEVRGWLGGYPPLFELDEKFKVEIASTREITNLRQIEDIPLPGGLSVGSMTDIKYIKNTEEPERIDGLLANSIEIHLQDTLDPKDRTLAENQVVNYLENLALPAGYILANQVFGTLEKDENDALFSVILAMILVFLIMGVLFESAMYPFIVMFSIPFAFLGSYWISMLSGVALGIMGKLGMVILVGIVVNNGIVLLDLIIKQVDDPTAKNRHGAILYACQRRLRPVLMTACTTIFGLFPMAFGQSNVIGIPFSPLGLSIIGGLVCSTLVTLFMIPLVFTLFLDFKNYARHILLQRLITVFPRLTFARIIPHKTLSRNSLKTWLRTKQPKQTI